MNNIYIFSMLPWTAQLLHRSHMLAEEMAGCGEKVVYVEKANSFNPLRWGHAKFEEGSVSLLTIYGLPYLKGWLKSVFRFNDLLITRALRKHLGEEQAIALVSTPHWSRAVGRTPAFSGRIFYDISDDYLLFAENRRWFEILEEYEEIALTLSKKSFLTMDTLQFKVDGQGVIIENGVDLRRFKEVSLVDLPGSGRKIGFIGGLYNWIDFGLIVDVAKAHPEDTVILIGPTDAQATMDMVTALPNVHYLGPVPRDRVHDYYASLDVGLIPFMPVKDYPRLETVNSNKVFQYLYFGYPVVSTSFPQVDRMAGKVLVGSTHEEFLALVDQALEMGRQEPQIDLEAMSWRSKAVRMLEVMEEES